MSAKARRLSLVELVRYGLTKTIPCAETPRAARRRRAKAADSGQRIAEQQTWQARGLYFSGGAVVGWFGPPKKNGSLIRINDHSNLRTCVDCGLAGYNTVRSRHDYRHGGDVRWMREPRCSRCFRAKARRYIPERDEQNRLFELHYELLNLAGSCRTLTNLRKDKRSKRAEELLQDAARAYPRLLALPMETALMKNEARDCSTPVVRTTTGLRDALFDVIDTMRRGESTPSRQNVIVRASAVIVESVFMEVEVRNHHLQTLPAVAKSIENEGPVGVPLTLGT